MGLGITGAEDPRCPLEGLEIPRLRASNGYADAHCLHKFKV